MRKSDIIAQIAEKTSIAKVDVLVALETFFIEIKSSLIEGEPVYIRGFGSFLLKRRAAKTGRHIRRGEPVPIPEHLIPIFKPSRNFAQAVREASLPIQDSPPMREEDM